MNSMSQGSTLLLPAPGISSVSISYQPVIGPRSLSLSEMCDGHEEQRISPLMLINILLNKISSPNSCYIRLMTPVLSPVTFVHISQFQNTGTMVANS